MKISPQERHQFNMRRYEIEEEVKQELLAQAKKKGPTDEDNADDVAFYLSSMIMGIFRDRLVQEYPSPEWTSLISIMVDARQKDLQRVFRQTLKEAAIQGGGG